jgi:LacI family transcriptional regulator
VSDFLDEKSGSTLQVQLEDLIRRRILDGRFKKQKRLPSVRELAAKYNVSMGTVSNALSNLKRQGLLQIRTNKGIFLSKGTRKREARRTGYLGVITQAQGDALRERIHFDTFNGISEFAAERGYKVLYLGTRQTREKTRSELPLGIRDVDGLVYMLSDEPSLPFIRAVQKSYLPLVMTDWFDPALKTDGVLIDNHAASLDVMRHLLDLGHRRIAFLNSLSTGPSANDRFEAYRAGLEEKGVPFVPGLVRACACDVMSGQLAMNDLLPLKPTAVFAFNDFLALGAILAALQSGLSVPGDISVAGFGNQGEVLGRGIGKHMTTVEVNMEEMGRIAAQLLFRRVNGYEGSPVLSRVSARLICGDTTARCGGTR